MKLNTFYSKVFLGILSVIPTASSLVAQVEGERCWFRNTCRGNDGNFPHTRVSEWQCTDNVGETYWSPRRQSYYCGDTEPRGSCCSRTAGNYIFNLSAVSSTVIFDNGR